MKNHLALTSLAALMLATPVKAQEAEEYVTPNSVIANASAEEWVSIAPEDLLVMELAPDAAGNARTVVIQLIPPPFSQPWVENIRTLARTHWWDGTSVNRVQDNYVTQWGDVTEEKVLPDGVVAPMARYVAEPIPASLYELALDLGNAEYPELLANLDPHSEGTMHWSGWPVASDFQSAWPIHCYGYVGVGRGYAPDTGTGAELYTIIGQPQRHMDRNLAVVGRIIEGMEHLSSLPRGSGELGFYTEEEASLRVPILSVRLGSEVSAASSSEAVGQQANLPVFEYLNTSSESFAQYVHVRANRDDAFYRVQAGGVDICGVQVPVRRAAE